MEGTESTTRERTTTKDGKQEVDQMVMMSSKPLHRFVKREPRSLGIVIVIFGCAELLMGFHLASENMCTSCGIYIPFWQGVLVHDIWLISSDAPEMFLVCGNLSIYTGVHPSKKMVTVCLAMYVVSLFGIIVSVGYRIQCFSDFGYLIHRANYQRMEEWVFHRVEQLFAVEGILFTSSLCVSVLLIFLCTVARLALKSTCTQVIVQHIPPPPSDTPSN